APGWAGLAAASADDYWGRAPSDAAYDLSAARNLVFFARGARGGESIQVKVAIAGDQPYGDSAPYPAETPWITLGKDWARYELPLESFDLRRVITPFAFVVSRAHGSGSGAFTFYLDEIYFEMEAPK